MRQSLVAGVLIVGSLVLSSAQQAGFPLAQVERPGGDFVQAIASDGSGGIWITGRTESNAASLATTPGAMHRVPLGGGDVFISHIAADGRLLYATYFGGNSIEEANGIARDAAGNIYITGTTGSFDFPNTTGAVHAATTGRDVFVTKLDPTGTQVLYSTYFGGASIEQATGIAVDAGGSAHVVGSTSGQGFPVTWGRCLDTWVSTYYVRLSPDGTTLLSATCLDDSRAAAVTLDGNGDAYVVGLAQRHFSPLMNAMKVVYPAGAASQGFLAKISGNSIPFSTLLGGSRDDWANDVSVTSLGIYVGGGGTSIDYQGAPARNASLAGNWTGWITKVRLDGAAVLGTTLLDGADADEVQSLRVSGSGGSEVVHATGLTNSSNFPVTASAAQPSSGGTYDAFYATIPAPNNTIGEPSYVSYLGGPSEDRSRALALDGSGGAWLAGYTFAAGLPMLNPRLTSSTPSFVARFGQPRNVPQAGSGDIVLYARDATAVVGAWELASDASAASGTRAWNRDAGFAKVTVPAASPANYVELTFQASAGVSYHLWLRMKADRDHWANDSVWVQFSDSVDGSGNPMWRTETAGATSVSLEDCTNCGEQGWGWNDNGYDDVAVPVRFAATGTHTIRIQQREDGISIDQVVLSSDRWATTAPGASKYDAMILAQTEAPPPPSDAREIVLYAAIDRSAGGTNWQAIADPTAAGGARLLNADQGQPKLSSPASAGTDYFDISFNADAGVAYHLWIRSRATDDYWTNDSVFVQFSGSVDAGGAPRFRIGDSSATVVSLEDCSGCGEQGWGWNDNGYGSVGEPIYFATSGPQTIRVLRREDGISIDQIVLSAGRYLSAAPGAAKNDNTVVPKS